MRRHGPRRRRGGIVSAVHMCDWVGIRSVYGLCTERSTTVFISSQHGPSKRRQSIKFDRTTVSTVFGLHQAAAGALIPPLSFVRIRGVHKRRAADAIAKRNPVHEMSAELSHYSSIEIGVLHQANHRVESPYASDALASHYACTADQHRAIEQHMRGKAPSRTKALAN
jgi:hypothetical protein